MNKNKHDLVSLLCQYGIELLVNKTTELGYGDGKPISFYSDCDCSFP